MTIGCYKSSLYPEIICYIQSGSDRSPNRYSHSTELFLLNRIPPGRASMKENRLESLEKGIAEKPTVISEIHFGLTFEGG